MLPFLRRKINTASFHEIIRKTRQNIKNFSSTGFMLTQDNFITTLENFYFVG
ncbi:hypothetical protein VU05_02240 [Desulfobulbus sp. F1]|nr:hypothetical protein [Desulfobulbus sp. F1]